MTRARVEARTGFDRLRSTLFEIEVGTTLNELVAAGLVETFTRRGAKKDRYRLTAAGKIVVQMMGLA